MSFVECSSESIVWHSLNNLVCYSSDESELEEVVLGEPESGGKSFLSQEVEAEEEEGPEDRVLSSAFFFGDLEEDEEDDEDEEDWTPAGVLEEDDDIDDGGDNLGRALEARERPFFEGRVLEKISDTEYRLVFPDGSLSSVVDCGDAVRDSGLRWMMRQFDVCRDIREANERISAKRKKCVGGLEFLEYLVESRNEPQRCQWVKECDDMPLVRRLLVERFNYRSLLMQAEALENGMANKKFSERITDLLKKHGMLVESVSCSNEKEWCISFEVNHLQRINLVHPFQSSLNKPRRFNAVNQVIQFAVSKLTSKYETQASDPEVWVTRINMSFPTIGSLFSGSLSDHTEFLAFIQSSNRRKSSSSSLANICRFMSSAVLNHMSQELDSSLVKMYAKFWISSAQKFDRDTEQRRRQDCFSALAFQVLSDRPICMDVEEYRIADSLISKELLHLQPNFSSSDLWSLCKCLIWKFHWILHPISPQRMASLRFSVEPQTGHITLFFSFPESSVEVSKDARFSDIMAPLKMFLSSPFRSASDHLWIDEAGNPLSSTSKYALVLLEQIHNALLDKNVVRIMHTMKILFARKSAYDPTIELKTAD